jgi:hypothetical protein
MTTGQNSACNSRSVPCQSASYDVGYGRPPRHTQFQKGRSGNPGGRPRRDPIDRLKTLTLQQAYRTIVVSKNGVAKQLPAIEAVLRSQIESAVNGNVRAQCAFLKSVQTFEREDAQAAGLETAALDTAALEEHTAALEEHAAALEEHIEGLVQQGLELERALQEARSAASTVGQKTECIATAPQGSELPGLDGIEPETAKTSARAPEDTRKETDAGNGVALAAGSAQTHTGAAHEVKPAAVRTPPLLDAGELNAAENDGGDAERSIDVAARPVRLPSGARIDTVTRCGFAEKTPPRQMPSPRDSEFCAAVQCGVDKDHIPARRSAEIRKFPDRFPVLKESGGRRRREDALAATRRMTARR